MYLEPTSHLDVISATLQLKIKHKCGTSHAYISLYTKDELETELHKDIDTIMELVKSNAHMGRFTKGDKCFYVMEVNDAHDPSLVLIVASDRMLPEVQLETPKTKVEATKEDAVPEVVEEPSPELVKATDILPMLETTAEVVDIKPKRGRKKKED